MRNAACLFLICAAIVAAPQVQDTVRIMPLGDSITNGVNAYSTYRRFLWYLLRDGGYVVDFVGTLTGPRLPDYDGHHDGHWGWYGEQIQANVGGYARSKHPDIVLCHLGTNDMASGGDAATTVAELGAIIDSLRSVNPATIVLMAQIIPHQNDASRAAIQSLNAAIPAMVSAKNSTQSPVVLVDQYTGFDYAAWLPDGVHPDSSGALFMAQRWFPVLQPFIEDYLTPALRGGAATRRPLFVVRGGTVLGRDAVTQAQVPALFDLRGRLASGVSTAQPGTDHAIFIMPAVADSRDHYPTESR